MTTHPWSSDSATHCQSDQLSSAAKMPKNLANTQKHFPRAFLKKQGGTGHVSMFLGHSGSFHTLRSDPSWRLKDEDFGWRVKQLQVKNTQAAGWLLWPPHWDMDVGAVHNLSWVGRQAPCQTSKSRICTSKWHTNSVPKTWGCNVLF